MPNARSAILRTRDDNGQLRMKAHCTDVVGVSFQGGNTNFRLIVPNLQHIIICSRNDVRLVTASEIANAVDSSLMSLKTEVRRADIQTPDLGKSKN